MITRIKVRNRFYVDRNKRYVRNTQGTFSINRYFFDWRYVFATDIL